LFLVCLVIAAAGVTLEAVWHVLISPTNFVRKNMKAEDIGVY